MNVIIAYLETMFSAYPQTPRLLEAKAELQTMMEDAYSGFRAEGLSENEAVGRVITEFGNLDDLAPTLGISQDIAPKAAAEAAAERAEAASRPTLPEITIHEAQGFADAQRQTRFRLALGVSSFVVSPIVLIILTVAASSDLISLSDGAAAAIGLAALFLFVAVGVLLLVSMTRDFAPYARIRERRFSRSREVTTWAETLDRQNDRKRISALQIAILCWVMSPVPLLLLSLVTDGTPNQDFWSVLGVSGLLILVALGLIIMLPANWARTVYTTLTSPGGREYAGGRDAASGGEEPPSIIGIIAPIYWPLMVVIYFAWSFIWDAWGESWIIWPIAGVLFGALAGGIGAWEHRRKALRDASPSEPRH